MSYKELNVYQRAYKVAIDLHLFLLNSKESKVIPQHASELRRHSREILANIAEGFYQKSPKAKRLFNYRAKDAANKVAMDLDFLLDTKAIPADECDYFQNEYNACAAQLYKLNQSILNKEIEKETEEVQEKEAVMA